MRNIIAIFFLLGSLVSCKNIIKETINSVENNKRENISDDNFKTIDVNSLYKLSVPKYMKEMKTLNDEASLQYANIYKEAYTIVINENKQGFIDYFKEIEEYDDTLPVIENYAQAQKKFFKESIQVHKIMPYGLTEINGYNARQLKINGTIEGQDIGYIIAFIEGKENLYMVMSWTLLDRENRFEATFEKINGSFKLIPNKSS